MALEHLASVLVASRRARRGDSEWPTDSRRHAGRPVLPSGGVSCPCPRPDRAVERRPRSRRRPWPERPSPDARIPGLRSGAALCTLIEAELAAGHDRRGARSLAQNSVERSPRGGFCTCSSALILRARLAPTSTATRLGAETLAHQALTTAAAIGAKSPDRRCPRGPGRRRRRLRQHARKPPDSSVPPMDLRETTGYGAASPNATPTSTRCEPPSAKTASRPPSTKAEPYPSTKPSPTPDEAEANGNGRRPAGPASPQPRSESPNWSKTDYPTPTSADGCCARPAPCKPI